MSNAEKYDQISEMWNLGMTGSEISLKLGMTRNAVLGAIHRMRQKGINIPTREKRISKKKANIKEIATIKLPRPKKPEARKPVNILDLKRTSCRYIVEEGDVYQTKYCNKKAERESYCADHYKICYYKAKK